MIDACVTPEMEVDMPNARVLIVEDEPFVGELVREILDIHGFEGAHVLNGKDGIDRAHQWKPDAIVLDLMLPDVDGFEVCRTLRRAEAAPAVVMLTGMHAHADRRRGFEAGADRFLTKPFRPEELIEELLSVLAEYKNTDPTGLRRRIIVDLEEDRGAVHAAEKLAESLVRTSPLANDEIDALATALRDIAARIAKRSSEFPDERWMLSCDIFRDRLALTLSSHGSDHLPTPSPRSLLDSTELPQPFSIPKAISHDVTFSAEGASLVMVKPFRSQS